MRNEFLYETGKHFDSMKQRFGPKYDIETGLILKKAGRAIPFTKAEYRAWVMKQQLAGLQCVYCLRPLKLKDMSPDHMTPVNRGGGLGLDNLAPSCAIDNTQKGELTAEEYKAFMRGLATFPELARKYILKKLRQRPVFRSHTNVGQRPPKVRISPVSRMRQPEARKLFTTMESPEEF